MFTLPETGLSAGPLVWSSSPHLQGGERNLALFPHMGIPDDTLQSIGEKIYIQDLLSIQLRFAYNGKKNYSHLENLNQAVHYSSSNMNKMCKEDTKK